MYRFVSLSLGSEHSYVVLLPGNIPFSLSVVEGCPGSNPLLPGLPYLPAYNIHPNCCSHSCATLRLSLALLLPLLILLFKFFHRWSFSIQVIPGIRLMIFTFPLRFVAISAYAKSGKPSHFSPVFRLFTASAYYYAFILIHT